jgi:hypothetical protein
MSLHDILIQFIFIILIISLSTYFFRIYYFKHINREGLKIKKPSNPLKMLSKIIPTIKCITKIGSNMRSCAFYYSMDIIFTILFILCMLGFCLLFNVNFLIWGLAFFLMVFIKQYFFYFFDFILWTAGYKNIFIRSKSQLSKCYCLSFIKSAFLPVSNVNYLNKSLQNPYFIGMAFTIFSGISYLIYQHYKKK